MATWSERFIIVKHTQMGFFHIYKPVRLLKCYEDKKEKKANASLKK